MKLYFWIIFVSSF